MPAPLSDPSAESMFSRATDRLRQLTSQFTNLFNNSTSAMAPTEKKAVHFGGGNIGRGFVAEFLHKSGYEVIFVDVVDSLIDRLQQQKSYKVIMVGSDNDEEVVITNYRAINSKTHEEDVIKEISTADVVTCSVGPNILKFIAPVIAKGVDARSNDIAPLAVIACENAIGATDTLAGFIKDERNTPKNRLADHDKRARYANSAIDRIVPAQSPDAGLDVTLEKFYEWVIDRTPFQDHEPPAIQGVKWVDDLVPYIERKLFTVNTGHAAAAYWGYSLRKRTVYDALQVKKVHDEVHRALAETKELIVGKHGITEEEQQEYMEKIMTRISNPHLEDAVERVGRAPLRKLSRKERFIGPAAELAELGKECWALLDCAEMAFRFQNVEEDEESKELAKIMTEKTPQEIVPQVCGIQPDHPLHDRLIEIVKKVKADMNDD